MGNAQGWLLQAVFPIFIRENWLILLFGFYSFLVSGLGHLYWQFPGGNLGSTADPPQRVCLPTGRAGDAPNIFEHIFFFFLAGGTLVFLRVLCHLSAADCSGTFFKGLGFGLSASTMLSIYGSSAMGI